MLIRIPTASIPTAIAPSGEPQHSIMRAAAALTRSIYLRVENTRHDVVFRVTRDDIGAPSHRAWIAGTIRVVAAQRQARSALASRRADVMAAAGKALVDAKTRHARGLSCWPTVRSMSPDVQRHLTDGPCLRRDCALCQRLNALHLLGARHRDRSFYLAPRGHSVRDFILEYV